MQIKILTLSHDSGIIFLICLIWQIMPFAGFCMIKLKLKDGYTLFYGENEGYLKKGLTARRVASFSSSGCDLLGRPEGNDRRLVEISGSAPIDIMTEALIAVSRAWRDKDTNEIFLLTCSSDGLIFDAAKKAEYVECRREIRGAGEYDTVLYKRHTDR